jgi:hypothetical protein
MEMSALAIECQELLEAIADRPARIIGFDAGLGLERVIDALARSNATRAACRSISPRLNVRTKWPSPITDGSE